MSETYSVVLTGKIADGMALEQAKANVGKLFKLNGEQLEKLFVGKPVAVRRGINREQAEKISAVLSKAGAVATVKSSRLQPSAQAAPAAAQNRSQPQSKQAAVDKLQQMAADKKQTAAKIKPTAPDLECPRCGHSQPFAAACGLCKMDLTLHIKRLQRRELVRAHRRQASA